MCESGRDKPGHDGEAMLASYNQRPAVSVREHDDQHARHDQAEPCYVGRFQALV